MEWHRNFFLHIILINQLLLNCFIFRLVENAAVCWNQEQNIKTSSGPLSALLKLKCSTSWFVKKIQDLSRATVPLRAIVMSEQSQHTPFRSNCESTIITWDHPLDCVTVLQGQPAAHHHIHCDLRTALRAGIPGVLGCRVQRYHQGTFSPL